MKKIWIKIADKIKKTWTSGKKKIKEGEIHRYEKKISKHKLRLSKLQHKYEKIKKEYDVLEQKNNANLKKEFQILSNCIAVELDKATINCKDIDIEQKSKVSTWAPFYPNDKNQNTYKIRIMMSDEYMHLLDKQYETYIELIVQNTKKIEEISNTLEKIINLNNRFKISIDLVQNYNNLLWKSLKRSTFLKFFLYSKLDYFNKIESNINSLGDKIYYDRNSRIYKCFIEYKGPKDDEDDGSGTGVRSKKGDY